jgi:hypothetical protein
MKAALIPLLSLVLASAAFAQNQTVQSPITMQQLMRELRLQGGNWTFKFDQPVYAKIVCEIPSFPDAKKVETTEFVSDAPSREISLFFLVSPMRVGDYPPPNAEQERAMKILLSGCKATDGTRILYYTEKFSMLPWINQDGQVGDYKPCIALNPELNTEYVLSDYYREGDPYEPKATICFVTSLDKATPIKPFKRGESRKFKAADE